MRRRTEIGPAPDWLGLSPTVARAMGWAPDERGPCRWVDAGGRTMVESVWWVDGRLDARWPIASVSHVGEGWLVLAPPDALDALRDRLGGLRRWLRVVRHVGDRGEVGHRERTCTVRANPALNER